MNSKKGIDFYLVVLLFFLVIHRMKRPWSPAENNRQETSMDISAAVVEAAEPNHLDGGNEAELSMLKAQRVCC